jgi:hypothetical protein
MKYSIHSQDPRYPTAQRVNPVVSGFLVISQEEVVDLLNAKDERITELEAQLKAVSNVVYSNALGLLTMNMGVDIEHMAQQVYAITGVDAEGRINKQVGE